MHKRLCKKILYKLARGSNTFFFTCNFCILIALVNQNTLEVYFSKLVFYLIFLVMSGLFITGLWMATGQKQFLPAR